MAQEWQDFIASSPERAVRYTHTPQFFRRQYFDTVVKPKFTGAPADLEAVWEDFNRRADTADQKILEPEMYQRAQVNRRQKPVGNPVPYSDFLATHLDGEGGFTAEEYRNNAVVRGIVRGAYFENVIQPRIPLTQDIGPIREDYNRRANNADTELGFIEKVGFDKQTQAKKSGLPSLTPVNLSEAPKDGSLLDSVAKDAARTLPLDEGEVSPRESKRGVRERYMARLQAEGKPKEIIDRLLFNPANRQPARTMDEITRDNLLDRMVASGTPAIDAAQILDSPEGQKVLAESRKAAIQYGAEMANQGDVTWTRLWQDFKANANRNIMDTAKNRVWAAAALDVDPTQELPRVALAKRLGAAADDYTAQLPEPLVGRGFWGQGVVDVGGMAPLMIESIAATMVGGPAAGTAVFASDQIGRHYRYAIEEAGLAPGMATRLAAISGGVLHASLEQASLNLARTPFGKSGLLAKAIDKATLKYTTAVARRPIVQGAVNFTANTAEQILQEGAQQAVEVLHNEFANYRGGKGFDLSQLKSQVMDAMKQAAAPSILVGAFLGAPSGVRVAGLSNLERQIDAAEAELKTAGAEQRSAVQEKLDQWNTRASELRQSLGWESPQDDAPLTTQGGPLDAPTVAAQPADQGFAPGTELEGPSGRVTVVETMPDPEGNGQVTIIRNAAGEEIPLDTAGLAEYKAIAKEAPKPAAAPKAEAPKQADIGGKSYAQGDVLVDKKSKRWYDVADAFSDGERGWVIATDRKTKERVSIAANELGGYRVRKPKPAVPEKPVPAEIPVPTAEQIRTTKGKGPAPLMLPPGPQIAPPRHAVVGGTKLTGKNERIFRGTKEYEVRALEYGDRYAPTDPRRKDDVTGVWIRDGKGRYALVPTAQLEEFGTEPNPNNIGQDATGASYAPLKWSRKIPAALRPEPQFDPNLPAGSKGRTPPAPATDAGDLQNIRRERDPKNRYPFRTGDTLPEDFKREGIAPPITTAEERSNARNTEESTVAKAKPAPVAAPAVKPERKPRAKKPKASAAPAQPEAPAPKAAPEPPVAQPEPAKAPAAAETEAVDGERDLSAELQAIREAEDELRRADAAYETQRKKYAKPDAARIPPPIRMEVMGKVEKRLFDARAAVQAAYQAYRDAEAKQPEPAPPAPAAEAPKVEAAGEARPPVNVTIHKGQDTTKTAKSGKTGTREIRVTSHPDGVAGVDQVTVTIRARYDSLTGRPPGKRSRVWSVVTGESHNKDRIVFAGDKLNYDEAEEIARSYVSIKDQPKGTQHPSKLIRPIAVYDLGAAEDGTIPASVKALAKAVVREGEDTLPKFTSRLKYLLGDTFAKLKGKIGDLWAAVKEDRGSFRMGEVLRPKVRSKARQAGRRWLVTGGAMPESFFGLDLLRKGFIAQWGKVLEMRSNAAMTVLKKEYGRLTAENMVPVNAVLAGEADPVTLPEAVRAPVMAMRDAITKLQDLLLKSGMLDEKMTAIVDASRGVYLTRTYRVFDDPKFYEETLRVIQELQGNPERLKVVQDALRFVQAAYYIPEDLSAVSWPELLRLGSKRGIAVKGRTKADVLADLEALAESKGREVSLAEAQNMLADFLAVASPVKGEVKTATAFAQGDVLGTMDLRSFMRRGNVPTELRELLGENKDPFLNFSTTGMRIAQMVANYKFLTAVAEVGKAQGVFFTKDQNRVGVPDPLQPDRITTANEAFPDTPGLAPLAGLRTNAEIKRAMMEAVTPVEMSGWVRWYLTTNAMVKIGKTGYSPIATTRNFTGNTIIAMMGGHYRLGKFADAKAVAWAAFVADGKQADEVERLTRLGIIGGSAQVGEIQAIMDEAHLRGTGNQGLYDTLWERSIAKAKAGHGKVMGFYQLMDDIWKVYAFYNERARYESVAAKKGWTAEELDYHVAAIVRDITPTYAMQPAWVKALRRWPFQGTFISFPYAMWRVLVMSGNQAIKEALDPDTAAIGASRIASLLSGIAAPVLLISANNLRLGITDEDDEWGRKFMPSYMKNGLILWIEKPHIGKDGRVRLRYVNLSFTVPTAVFLDPIMALWRGAKSGEFVEGMKQALLETLGPFTAEEILAGALMDVRDNEARSGRPIFNEQEMNDWQQLRRSAGKVVKYIAKEALAPGFISQGQELWQGYQGFVNLYGKKYSMVESAASIASGVRIENKDLKSSLMFEMGRRFSAAKDAVAIVTEEAATVKKNPTEADLRAAVQSAEKSQQYNWVRTRELVLAARGMGLPERDIREAMTASGMGKQRVADILAGRYYVWTPGSQFMSNVANRIEASEGAISGAREIARRRLIIERIARENARMNLGILPGNVQPIWRRGD